VREGPGAQEAQMCEAARQREIGWSSRQAQPWGFQVSVRTDNRVGIAGLGLLCCCLAFAGFAPARASAFAQNPAWTVSVVAAPTNFAPEDKTGKDHYNVIITNTGDAPTDGSTITISDVLPAKLALGAAGVSGTELFSEAPLSCTGSTCTYSGVMPAGDRFTLTVPVDVEPGAAQTETNRVTVSGGGAEEVSASTPTAISSSFPGYGIAPGSFSTTLSSTQAGAHADLTTSFYLSTNSEGSAGGQLKDVIDELPPGFAGDPIAIPTCSADQLNTVGKEFGFGCPLDSQVGTIAVTVGGPAIEGNSFVIIAPVYNMEGFGGEVTRLGFNVSVVSTNTVVTVRPGDDGLTATVPDIVQGTLQVWSSVLTVWGVPGDPSHDLMRGRVCENTFCFAAGVAPFPKEGIPSPIAAMPFLSNPTQCGAPLEAHLSVDSWQEREVLRSASANLGPMDGCERLSFGPGLSAEPTTKRAEAPSGLDVSLNVPQTYNNGTALATSNLKNAVVTLPEGMTVNPSAGVGLGTCTPSQYEAEVLDTPPGEGCPNESSLGTVETETPVLKEKLTGSVFLAQPYNNPFPEQGHPNGSLLAIYVIQRLPSRGIFVKLAGKITSNPETGQLVTTFENNPQLPFNLFTLKFRPGNAAPLVTPPACGEYAAQAQFSSWSEPETPANALGDFNITQGVGGGPCPAGGVPPFAPQIVSAGTLSNAAGTYSPFYLRIARNDGEQEITRFSTVLPPGLTGNLTGIPFCPDADIEAARTKTGTEETNEPSCPAASEIGRTLVGAGVGSDSVLAQTPGKIYLAGPYHGAPLSIVSITSATVGPFDLGTVVIRFALRINPATAQVEVDASGSDPIPHIIRGIVVHVRDIRVHVNRPNFILDPTSCNPMAIKATIAGAGANPAGQVPVEVNERFQVTNCAALGFKPEFKVSTSGKTSKADGASLTAKVSFPSSALGTQANIAYVKVALPKQLPSRLTTLQQACLASVFEANPASCPAASIVGHAKAVTPLIPVPLEGPAYFVSHGGEAFPSLIVVLQGYGITINLVGTTFISKAGITSSTFKTVPDQPVTSFELTLPEGPFSALATNYHLCTQKLTMPTEFVAQNGAELRETTKISVTGCPKAKRSSKHRHKREGKKKKPKKKWRLAFTRAQSGPMGAAR
jgi:hypothetical protein